MEKDFLLNFFGVSDEIIEQSKILSWPIPGNANKEKGDLGLLPNDSSIEAWQVPISSARLLHFLVLIKKAKVILELGTSLGFSTIWLALGAKETGGHVYGTEIFPAKTILAKDNFKKARVDEYITLLEQDILEVLQHWDKNRKIDFVFMDADKQRYDQYIDPLWLLMDDHALIVVDNVGNYGQYMKPFLEKCKSLQAATHFLNIDNGLLFILKNGGENLLNAAGIFD